MSRSKLVDHLRSLDYPPDWKERAHRVRIRDNFACRRCGRRDLRLHVHHINGRSHELWNLETLCEACHEAEHPWLKAAHRSRTRGGPRSTYTQAPRIRAPTERELLLQRISNAKSREQQLNYMQTYGVYSRQPQTPLFWRIVGWIKPSAPCETCSKIERLTRYRDRWVCGDCRAHGIQWEQEQARQRLKADAENAARERRALETQLARMDEANAKKYVTPDLGGVGAKELQQVLELERGSR